MIAVIALLAAVMSLVLNGFIAYQVRKVMDAIEAANKPKMIRKWCRIHRKNVLTTSDSITCRDCKN